MQNLRFANNPNNHSIYRLSNWQNYFLDQQIVAKNPEKSSENTKNNQKQEFQKEGEINVKPFLDPSDGGTLGQENPNQIPILLMVCVGIVILLIIANSFLPFFGQRTPNEEKSSEIVEDNLGDQFTHDDDKQSMSATSVAVDYPDDYNYTDTQEEQQIAIENSQDLILNQAKQENWKTIKQIFNSNKINDKKGNTYE